MNYGKLNKNILIELLNNVNNLEVLTDEELDIRIRLIHKEKRRRERLNKVGRIKKELLIIRKHYPDLYSVTKIIESIKDIANRKIYLNDGSIIDIRNDEHLLIKILHRIRSDLDDKNLMESIMYFLEQNNQLHVFFDCDIQPIVQLSESS